MESIKRSYIIHSFILVFVFCFGSCTFDINSNHNLMIVVDLSVSMKQNLPGGQNRLEKTKLSLCDFIDQNVPPYFNIGLRSFSDNTEEVRKPIKAKKQNVNQIKKAIMDLPFQGGTNFSSILEELPNDFNGLYGNNYVLIAGDGQYGSSVYTEVVKCRKQIEQFGIVKGISMGIETSASETNNLTEIAKHFTSEGLEFAFASVKPDDFKTLATEFYKISYALLFLFRIIAFCMCVVITFLFIEVINELVRKTGFSPRQSAIISGLMLPVLLYYCFLYYLSDILNDNINNVIGFIFVLTFFYFLLGSMFTQTEPSNHSSKEDFDL